MPKIRMAWAYVIRKVFWIGTVRYHWPMSVHASQAFSIASWTDSEDLPVISQEESGLKIPSALG